MLKYALRENLLTADENNFMAQIMNSRSYSLNDIIDHMVQRGSSLTRVDIVAALELYTDVVSTLLSQGGSINTPLMNITWSIKGVFKGANDRYDSARHTLQCNMHTSAYLKDKLRQIRVEKVQAIENLPYITEVMEALNKIAQTTFAAGNTLEILGAKLKFDQTDPEQGAFLVSGDGTQIPCPSIIENRPARLTIIIPADTPAGNYYLEVRTKMDGGRKQTKHLKVGKYAKLLTIA